MPVITPLTTVRRCGTAVLCTAVVLSSGGWPRLAAQTTTVRCEAKDSQRVTCAADTSQGVMLTRQLSTEGCWKDETWGADANGIWVSDRCRADFTVAGAAGPTAAAPSDQEQKDTGGGGAGKTIAIVGGIAAAAVVTGLIVRGNDDDDDKAWGGGGWGIGNNRIVRCESRQERRRTCAIRKGADVEMRRQLSDRPCRRGSSWGKDKSYIWVDDGCRAEFWVRD